MKGWAKPAAVVLAAAFVYGCDRRPDDGGTTGAGPASPSPAVKRPVPSAAVTRAELDGVGPAARPYRLALVVKTRNNPFFDPMIKAAEAEAKALGAELEVQSPAQESDKERQFGIVQDLTARKVDAILIAPADSKGIVPALHQAEQKGVLVINLDNRVDRPTALIAGLELGGYVGADNEAGGRLAGEEMARRLPPGSKVAILEGIRGADNAEARKRGFEQAAGSGGPAAAPGRGVSPTRPTGSTRPTGPTGVAPAGKGAGPLDIAVVDTAEWDTQKAYAKFQSMLAAHPDLKGLFCANDKMALGALKSIEEAGKKGRLTVIGYDNIPDVQPYLRSGELHATVEQHPDLMGKYGVRMAVGVLNRSLPARGEFLVPLELVKGK